MPWWPGIALVVCGVAVFLFGFMNTDIEAPQASDYGNRFIWPGIITAAVGVVVLGMTLAAKLF
jgi:hypothetical protein